MLQEVLLRKIVKLQSFSLGILLLSNLIGAEEKKPLEPLDEDFLEFIANISEVDGEIVDSLDMLEIADNEMTVNASLEDELNREIKPDDSKELNRSDSLVGEKKL